MEALAKKRVGTELFVALRSAAWVRCWARSTGGLCCADAAQRFDARLPGTRRSRAANERRDVAPQRPTHLRRQAHLVPTLSGRRGVRRRFACTPGIHALSPAFCARSLVLHAACERLHRPVLPGRRPQLHPERVVRCASGIRPSAGCASARCSGNAQRRRETPTSSGTTCLRDAHQRCWAKDSTALSVSKH